MYKRQVLYRLEYNFVLAPITHITGQKRSEPILIRGRATRADTHEAGKYEYVYVRVRVLVHKFSGHLIQPLFVASNCAEAIAGKL